jgi:hypothetical protein
MRPPAALRNGLWEQRPRPWTRPRRALLQNRNQLPPSQLLRIVDLAQVQQVPLPRARSQPSCSRQRSSNDAACCPSRDLCSRNMMAVNYLHIRGSENRLGRNYQQFWLSRPRRPLLVNDLFRENRAPAGRIDEGRLIATEAVAASGCTTLQRPLLCRFLDAGNNEGLGTFS